MGYTHYWYRTREIKPEVFNKIVSDFSKLIPMFKTLDVKLAGGSGEGDPEITNELVCFNGAIHCGHKKNNSIVIPWPALSTKFGVAPDSEQAVSGAWFAGVELNQRTCNGDCSYETFYFPRVLEKQGYESTNNKGLIFNFTKTAFRPYDLAVTAFLIIAKHYIKRNINVSSDGEWVHWLDAAKICQNAFGYGMDFKI